MVDTLSKKSAWSKQGFEEVPSGESPERGRRDVRDYQFSAWPTLLDYCTSRHESSPSKPAQHHSGCVHHRRPKLRLQTRLESQDPANFGSNLTQLQTDYGSQRYDI